MSPQRGYSARHEVRQFHFTAWPEHGVPYHATGLLAFIRRVKASTPPDAGPIVIHCRWGQGIHRRREAGSGVGRRSLWEMGLGSSYLGTEERRE